MTPPAARPALDGVRVLEVGSGIASAWAAKLLADLGAEVIKIEPPSGDPSRHIGPYPADAVGDPNLSGLFLGMNTNKISRVLDLDTDAGRVDLNGLVSETDIVLHSFSPSSAAAVGLDAGPLLAQRPELVVCAITAFGHTGPQAEWHAEELNVVQGGGWGMLIPGDATDPTAPPLTVPDNLAHCQAATAAAMAIVAAFDHSDRTGVGEFIDMSILAHVTASLEAAFIAWSYRREIATRTGGRLLAPWKIFRCKDGLVFLATIEQDQWLRLVEMMGAPDWATIGIFDENESRAQNHDVLGVYIEEWMADHTVEWLFHEGQRRRICFAPVFEMGDLAAQDHLSERGFFHELPATSSSGETRTVAHLGSPFRATPNSWELRRPAPVLDPLSTPGFSPRTTPPIANARKEPTANSASDRPLTGVRVIDFSWVWAGPFATLHLGYLGAEVIKVESSNRPGLGRRLPVSPPEMEPTLNTSAYFNQWDQGKKSVEVDLSTPAGIDQVLELVASADVVIDNYATGVMGRLGLSDERLRAVNPSVIIASITGFGHTGPLATYMGYGPATAPLSGLSAMTGHVGGQPVEAGISFGDPAAGLSAGFAIVAALHHRRRTGTATRIDVALWEASAVNAVQGWMTWALRGEQRRPMGNRHEVHSPHGCFPGPGDDRWISIACTGASHWQALAGLIEPSLADDERFATAALRKANEDELEPLIAQWTRDKGVWALTEQLQARGVPAYPSLTTAELEDNPQLVARSFFERFDHPEVGVRSHAGVPWITLNAANGVVSRAPLLGEHTAEVFAGMRSEAPGNR